MSPCWAFHWLYGSFIFQNCLSPFLAWANGMATPLKEGKKKFVPTPYPKRKRLDLHYCTLNLSLAACKFYS
jgi:hypothetical protein